MSSNQIELYNVRYLMELGAGRDTWRIWGQVVGHPIYEDGHYIYPSTPKSFDEDEDVFIGTSGRTYKIMSYDGSFGRDRFVEQIKKDILNGGFESR